MCAQQVLQVSLILSKGREHYLDVFKAQEHLSKKNLTETCYLS